MKIVIAILIGVSLSIIYGLAYYANSKISKPNNLKKHICEECNSNCKISEVNHK